MTGCVLDLDLNDVATIPGEGNIVILAARTCDLSQKAHGIVRVNKPRETLTVKLNGRLLGQQPLEQDIRNREIVKSPKEILEPIRQNELVVRRVVRQHKITVGGTDIGAADQGEQSLVTAGGEQSQSGVAVIEVNVDGIIVPSRTLVV